MDNVSLKYIYGLSSSSNLNNIRYIGYSSNPADRLHEHLKDINRKYVKTYKKNWISKEILNGNNIIVTIIDEAKSNDEAKTKEINIIKLFKSIGAHLVNGTLGGDGVVCTEIVRKKMSINRTGIFHTEETKRNLSKKLKGRKLSKEHILKIGLANKGKCGRIWTDSEKLAASKRNKGQLSNRKGIKVSEMERDRLSKLRLGIPSKRKIKINQYSLSKIFIKQFDSVSEATKFLKINNIVRCLKGKRPTAGGFIWEYNL